MDEEEEEEDEKAKSKGNAFLSQFACDFRFEEVTVTGQEGTTAVVSSRAGNVTQFGRRESDGPLP